ncbi:MAG: hypothetical protein GY742_15810 [Hyphomicrobiales bacterium]|nr:hypothetical protein [Hyphomicrobiales bacterium]
MPVDKPYAFTFWESETPKPAYISLCAETHIRNLSAKFQLIQLNFESCLEWAPNRDELFRYCEPASEGQSTDLAGRKLALFCDLLRVQLLHKHGGFWVDADTLVFPQFSALADMVDGYQLIASEAEGGRIANTVMGCMPGSKFMKEFAGRIDIVLKEKEKTAEREAGWGEYGHWITRELLLSSGDQDIFILPFGMIIPFDNQTKNTIFGPASEFANLIPATSLGVSFFNNSISVENRSKSSQELLSEDTVFSRAYRIAMGQATKTEGWKPLPLSANQFEPYNRLVQSRDVTRALEKKSRNMIVLKEKLKQRNTKITQLREVARKLAVSDVSEPLAKVHREKVFGTIFNEGLWEMGGSRSGCGSSKRQTEALRLELPKLLRKHNVRTLLDLPCGDFNWMQHVDLAGIHYIGGDIVPDIIAENAKYEREDRTFQVIDIVNDDLPKADFLLCRDCYSHLPNAQVIQSLDNLAEGKCAYLLVTNYPETGTNEDIVVGDFRRINFEKAPFFLPTPQDILVEQHPNPKHADKALALWHRSDLQLAKQQRSVFARKRVDE